MKFSRLRGALLATSSAIALIAGNERPAEAGPAPCAFNNVNGGVDNTSPNNCISYNNGTSFAGDVTNDSSLTATHPYPPTNGGTSTGISVVAAGTTLTGNIINNGTISAPQYGINIGAGEFGGTPGSGSSLVGSITNNGSITGGGGGGIVVRQSSVAGSITNATGATINTTNVGIVVTGVSGNLASVGGSVTNNGTIITAGNDGIFVQFSTVGGSITSTDSINTNGGFVAIEASSSVITGSITNIGTATASGLGIFVDNSSVGGSVVNKGTINASFGIGIQGSPGVSTITGDVVNTGVINAASQSGILLVGAVTIGGGISNSGTITTNGAGTVSGIGVAGATVNGSIVNTPAGNISAKGIGIFVTSSSSVGVGSVKGGIVNQGSITAKTGIAVGGLSTVAGGITNSGNITGSRAAIDLATLFGGEGAATTINQQAGTITGDILLSALADTVNVTGGAIAGNIVGQGSSNTINFALGSGTFTYANSFTGINQVNVNSGTVVLEGADTVTNFAINNGTVVVGNNLAFGTAVVTMAPGTTLSFASTGNFTVANNFKISGDPFFTPPSGTIQTLSGVIADGGSPGILDMTGTGTLVLSGANTYSGGTFVEAGTLQIAGAGTLGGTTGPLSVSGGLLDLGGTKQMTGPLALTGGTIQNGELDATSFGVQAGTISAVLGGAGALTKTGPGTVLLTGASTYTGPTAVNGGILDVNGSLVSTVTVNNGGTLKGNGTVGGLGVASGGIVAPGNSIGTLNVAGNVTFAAGSIYQVEVNAAGQGDKILATGKATLSGGTVQVFAAPGAYAPLTRYTILTANGGVNGTFAQLLGSGLTAGSIFLTPTLSYDANDVFLSLSQAPFASVAFTRNEAATAGAIQALGAGNPVFNAVFAQTTAAGARQAFDALSGEIHASAVTAAFEDQRLPREAILDRLSQPAEQPVLGAATTMTGAYAADLPSHKPALAPVAVQMVQPRLFGLWGTGFGDWGKTDGDHNAAKLTRDTGGFIIGADAERQFLDGTWRFGVAGGYTDDSLKVQARSSSGDYQSIFGALYGKATYGAIDVKAGAILASTNTHTSRSIIFPGFADAAGSSYGGYAAQGFGELGYRLPFHGTLWSYVPWLSSLTATYEPFLQGAVIHIDQNRYVETALNAGLVGAARGYDLGTTTLGLRTQYQLASLPGFTWTSMLGWRHAFGDVRPSVVQSFAGSFNSFSVAGVPIDRDAFVSETSLDYAVSQRVTVGVSYSGQYGRRATDSAFKGHVDVSFW